MRTPPDQPKKRRRPSLFAGLAGITATATLATVLVPTPASADVETVPAVFHDTLEYGGTLELELDLPVEASNPDTGCTSLELPWVVLTDDETGETYLGDEWYYSDEVQFRNTDIRYPADSVTLSFYDKVSAGAECLDRDPDDYLPGASPYKIIHLDVDWEKPEILDIYPATYDGLDRVFVELSPRWDGFGKPQDRGGPTVYEITDYGLPTQRIHTYDWPCYQSLELSSGDTCYLLSGYDNGDLIGIAAMPGGEQAQDSDVWPPVGAISHKLYTHREADNAEDPALTRAGPNEAMECYQMCAGDPVDTSNGTLFDRQVDLQIPGRIGIELQRSYSTGQVDTTGAFGPGTAFSYDMHIEDESFSEVAIVEPSGNQTAFTGYGTLTPVSDAVRADLVETNDGWEYTRWDENLTYVFDGEGDLTAIRDNNGNTVTLTHDAGHVSRITEGDRWIDLTWSGDLITKATDHTGREVNYAYNAAGHLETVTDPAGRTRQYVYDDAGLVTTLTAPDGGVTSNVYDAEGRVITQTMPDGQVLSFDYGTPDNFGEVTNTETVGDIVRTYTYVNGRIAEFTDTSDPLAAFTQSYDAEGRALIKNYVDGYPRQEIYGYDTAGNRSVVTELTTGATTTAEFDAQHQLVASTDAAGVRTEFTRDSAGNVTASTVVATDGSPSLVTSYQIDTNGDQLSVTDPEGGQTSMTYAPTGEIATITDPEGGITVQDYDSLGRLVEITSPGGNVAGVSQAESELFTKRYAYDLLGNALSVTDAQGVTAYTYDSMSRPITVTDARGKVRSSEYDSVGRLLKDIAPDGSFDQFSYDVDTGLRASWTDPNGLMTAYSYDAGSTTVTSPSGDVHTTSIELRGENVVTLQDGEVIKRATARTSSTYPDENTSLIERLDIAGRVTKTETPDGNVDYTYDGFGRLIAQEGTDRNVSYTYDDNSLVTGITYPDGTTVSREYDDARRVQTTTDWAGGERAFTYDAEGRVAEMTSDTGLGYTQTFDGLHTTGKTWSDGTTEIAAYGQTFDATGGLIASRDGEAYTFDDNGGLSAAGSDQITWDGRLLTGLGGTSLSYGAQSGRLDTVSDGSTSLSYTYDDQGNRTSVSDGTIAVEYGWNQLGQLTSLGAASYEYGTDGIRTSVDGAAQVYDQGLKLLSDGSMKYLWAPDGSLLAQAPLGGTSGTQEAVTDLHGSVRQILDGALTEIAQYSYSAFGQRSLEAGTDVTAMGFTSEQHDESGLIYLRYRYYDSAVGQFISVDPMVSSTLDPYGYANGNPLQVVDPLGLFGWRDVGTVLGYVALAAAIASVTVATGGTALVVAGAIGTGAGVVGAGISVAETVVDCLAKPDADACAWSASGLALSAIPMMKPVRGVIDNLGTAARSTLPTNAAGAAGAAERKTLSQLGYISPDVAGVAHGALRNDC